MNWKLCLISIVLATLLAGCAAKEEKPAPPPVVVTNYVYADCGTPPQRSEVDFRQVDWRILKFDGENLFTLTSKGYEDLAFNISEIIKGSKEQKAELIYYEKCLSRQKDLSDG